MLRDRRRLATDGVLIVVATIAADTAEVVGDPEVIVRGFEAPDGDEEQLLDTIRDAVDDALDDCQAKGIKEVQLVQERLHDALAAEDLAADRQAPDGAAGRRRGLTQPARALGNGCSGARRSVVRGHEYHRQWPGRPRDGPIALLVQSRLGARVRPPSALRPPSGSVRRAALPLSAGTTSSAGLCIAAGVFLACIEYLGWDGGVVGQKLDGLLRLLIGEATMAVPPIAIGAGALIFLDSPVRRLRPLRLGVVTAMATLVLALSTTDTVEAEQHGGLIGAYARTLLEHLVGGVGVSILIALGTLAAIVLLTGASVGLVMRRSGEHVARAAGAGARLGGEVARRYRERPTGPPTLTAVPGGAGKRSKKAPAPLDGSQEYSDLFGDVPEFEIPGDEPESLPEVLEGASRWRTCRSRPPSSRTTCRPTRR